MYAPLWYDKGPEAYEGDFGEHGGSPVYSVYPSIFEPLWPKPLTEMTVVKFSYQLKLTNHTILYK